MTENAAVYYKDYWVGAAQERDRRGYYDHLYHHVLPKIKLEPGLRILDVAGGNGQFLRYLGITDADVIDISQSGLAEAKSAGFGTIYGDVEKRFPIAEESYDVAFCFEVLEHLHRPNKTLSEIHHVLKPEGVLYIGQPNMRADGEHHVRRYYLAALLNDVRKAGFRIDWVDHVPAYSVREAILSDIQNNPSFVRKSIQCVNLMLSFLPWNIRYRMARIIPDRFSLIFVVKAVKR